jgi:hypothetical protein
MQDKVIRARLERHWKASDASDLVAEHDIYHEDAELHYPQSGERFHGRDKIQMSRTIQPNEKHFAVQRIMGSGDIWITEYVLSYDGKPSYVVSIMEFRDGFVASETQYFSDGFDAPASRAHLVEQHTSPWAGGQPRCV